MKDFILNNGNTIPCIGFGTCIHGKDVDFEKTICGAIEIGYRFFDPLQEKRVEILSAIA